MLTDDELWKLWEANTEQPFPDYFVDFKRAAKVILAAHTAKLLADVEMPEPVGYQWLDTGNFRKVIPNHAEKPDWNAVHTTYQLQAYAAACAAQAWMYRSKETEDTFLQYARLKSELRGGFFETPLYAGAAPAAQSCCKGKEELEKLLQELSKQSGWASTVIRKYLNEMSSKEK